MACREQRPQAELIRVAKTSKGALSVFAPADPESRLAGRRVPAPQGRSTYVCATRECVEFALKEHKKRAPLSHALRTPLDSAVVAKIRAILEGPTMAGLPLPPKKI